MPLKQDMESFGEDPITEIDIFYNSCLVFNISMRGLCTLGQIQNDLLHEEIQLPQKYLFMVNQRKVHTTSFIFVKCITNVCILTIELKPFVQILERREKTIKCKDIHNKTLHIVT